MTAKRHAAIQLLEGANTLTRMAMGELARDPEVDTATYNRIVDTILQPGKVQRLIFDLSMERI